MKSIAFAFSLAAGVATMLPAVAQTDPATTPGTAPTAPPLAEPADSPGMLSRFGAWFTGWGEGWETGSRWRVMYGPYTYHYTYDPEHAYVYMWGAERQRADGLTFGGTWFRNSFGQPSAYVYVGQTWRNLAGVEPLYAQLTGGILYGYKYPYENKVPYVHHGFSPGIVPSLGWQITPSFSAQLNFLGTNALMLQLAVDIR